MRVKVLYILFFLVALTILGQIIVTQYGPNGELLRNLSNSKCYKIKPVYASRGNILANDGRILATEAPFYNVRLDFSVPSLNDTIFYSNVNALSDSLANLLGNSSAFYCSKLTDIYKRAQAGGRGSKDQLLVNKINQLQLDRLKTFPLFANGKSGLMTPKDTVRYLPFGTLASYTIGKARTHGLEHTYNDILQGTNGQNKCVRLVGDVWVPIVDSVNRDAVDGCDILTTLDIDLQDVAENSLRQQLEANQALTGTAVVMEVQTGEIRAMTNLTHYPNGTITDDYNYATNMRNEPGSTFKLVSLLAILEQAGLSTDYVIRCSPNGREVINQTLVTDTHNTLSGKMTVKEMMAASSNIGFAKLIDQLYRDRPEVYVNFVKGLGINRPANIQRQKDGASPVIKDPARKRETDWNRMSLTKMAYGYAIELTPMHTLMLYNAVANDGKLLAPILVKEIRKDGQTIEKFSAEVVNPKICSDKVLHSVRECLQEVVENGTAGLLKNEHYTVAGKTGTAQVAQGARGYRTADGGMDYLATLVGYFPAEAPKYSCIVVIKTHHRPGERNSYYGARLAGPVFKDIINYIYALDTEWRSDVTDTLSHNRNMEIKGGSMEQIRRAAAALDIPTSLTQRDTGWATADNKAGLTITPVVSEDYIMPDITGMGLKDALFMLEEMGFRVSFSGEGAVVYQSIEAGAPYDKGDEINIVLGRAKRKNTDSDENGKSIQTVGL